MSIDNTPKDTPLKAPWKAGQSGNPAGRPKGSRNQFSELFLKSFMEDFEQNGVSAIVAVRTEDPSTYLRVAASIIPKEFTVKEDNSSLERLLEQHSVEELDKLINGLVTLGAAGIGKKDQKKERSTDKPDSLH